MSISKLVILLSCIALGAYGCSDSKTSPDLDASSGDLGVDAGDPDAGDPDVGMDAGDPDASDPDAGMDAGDPDVGMDAGDPDVGMDAGMDAGFDAGVDAGPPVPGCVGTRPSCDTLAGLQCSQAGCMTTTTGACEGTAAACVTYTGDFVVCLASGCDYNFGSDACTGTPEPCAAININLCGTQFGPTGCTPTNACTGTADACSTYTTAGVCNLQVGCTWQ